MFSIWVPPERTARSYFDQANEQIDSIESFVRRSSPLVGFARTADDIEKFVKEGKFVAMLGLEGGHHILNDLDKLEHLYRRGVRYMTLTWNNSTVWATSAKDESDTSVKLGHKGLTELGKQVIRKMNELGMMVDVSHVGEQTFWDALATTTKPVIASHSSAYSLCPHFRNLKDEQIKAVAKNGGVVFINFNPGFIDSTFDAKRERLTSKYKTRLDSLKAIFSPDSWDYVVARDSLMHHELEAIRPPLSRLIDHIDYVTKLVGADHVGLGSDFDGITMTPLEMDDVTFLPNVTRELQNRGYSVRDIEKILGENFLRVLRANSK